MNRKIYIMIVVMLCAIFQKIVQGKGENNARESIVYSKELGSKVTNVVIAKWFAFDSMSYSTRAAILYYACVKEYSGIYKNSSEMTRNRSFMPRAKAISTYEEIINGRGAFINDYVFRPLEDDLTSASGIRVISGANSGYIGTESLESKKAATPEPASTLMLGVGALGLITRRKR